MKTILNKQLFFAAALGFLPFATHAAVVDLTGSNNSGTANGAVFDWTDAQPTGTGVIQPFLRVQENGMEQGYNTSGGIPFDDKAGPWTHDVQFSDLQATTVTINGTAYFKVMLDVNEPGGSNSLISLNQLMIYTSPTGSQTTLDIASLGTLRFDLDGNGNNSVLLDASRNSGSGSGDMFAYIPVANFAGVSGTDYLYLYCNFGDAAGTTEGGFEEWSLVNNLSPVPEMSALFPIIGLIAAVGLTHLLRRRRLAQTLANS